MFRSTRSPMSGRHLFAAGVMAFASSVAACSDAATAPKAPAVAAPTTPSALVLSVGVTANVRLADTTGTTLKEPGWVKFTSGNDTMSVRDNSAKDEDPSIGFIKVKLTKTKQYKACFIRSAHYMPDLDGQVNYEYCRTSTTASNAVHLGTLIGQRSPMFVFLAKDEFGAPAGGATFEIHTPNNGWTLPFQDGNPSYDESAGADGVAIYTLNFPFWTRVCEINPPLKMAITSQSCFFINAKWGGTYTYTFTHEHKIF